jgi:hypothetical protein
MQWLCMLHTRQFTPHTAAVYREKSGYRTGAATAPGTALGAKLAMALHVLLRRCCAQVDDHHNVPPPQPRLIAYLDGRDDAIDSRHAAAAGGCGDSEDVLPNVIELRLCYLMWASGGSQQA